MNEGEHLARRNRCSRECDPKILNREMLSWHHEHAVVSDCICTTVSCRMKRGDVLWHESGEVVEVFQGVDNRGRRPRRRPSRSRVATAPNANGKILACENSNPTR